MDVFFETFSSMLPLLASAGSVVVQLAPMGEVRGWRTAGSTGGFPFLNIFNIAVNQMMNVTYGNVSGNLALQCVGAMGILIALYYCRCFSRVCDGEERAVSRNTHLLNFPPRCCAP